MTTNRENEFIDIVEDAGYLAVREPASGAKHDLDVLMIIEGELYVVEHKYAGKGSECRFVIDEDYKGDPGDVRPLIEYARKYGAIPVLSCRFYRDTTHYLLDAWEYIDHDAGSVGFTKSKRDQMVELEELFVDGDTGFEAKKLSKILG